MGYRILIVDDSPAMRAFIRRAIRLSGLDVSQYLEAGNGLEALAVLRAGNIDVVLTDINMPVMDGEEMLRRMAQDEALRRVPSVVVSTDASGMRKERMFALGARGYMGKPFRPEDVREAIEASLGRVYA